MSTENTTNKGEQLYLVATATLRNFSMDYSILERTGPEEIKDDDLDALWASLASRSGGLKNPNKDAGSKRTEVHTTRSSGRVTVEPSNLLQIRQRARALPDILANAGDKGVLQAEQAVAKFKKNASRILGANVGKAGDEIRAVLDEINLHRCTVYQIDVYLRRSDFSPFEGSTLGNDGLHHGSIKLRKLFTMAQPTDNLLRVMMQEIANSNRRLSYDNTLVIASLDGRTREGKASSFGIVPKGWDWNSKKDASIANYLMQLRNNISPSIPGSSSNTDG